MQLTNYIIKKMVEYHIIDNDDKEIYIYGLNTGIMIILKFAHFFNLFLFNEKNGYGYNFIIIIYSFTFP